MDCIIDLEFANSRIRWRKRLSRDFWNVIRFNLVAIIKLCETKNRMGDGSEVSLELVPLVLREEICFCQAGKREVDGEEGSRAQQTVPPDQTGEWGKERLPTRLRRILRQVARKCSHLVLDQHNDKSLIVRS